MCAPRSILVQRNDFPMSLVTGSYSSVTHFTVTVFAVGFP